MRSGGREERERRGESKCLIGPGPLSPGALMSLMLALYLILRALRLVIDSESTFSQIKYSLVRLWKGAWRAPETGGSWTTWSLLTLGSNCCS